MEYSCYHGMLMDRISPNLLNLHSWISDVNTSVRYLIFLFQFANEPVCHSLLSTLGMVWWFGRWVSEIAHDRIFILHVPLHLFAFTLHLMHICQFCICVQSAAKLFEHLRLYLLAFTGFMQNLDKPFSCNN